MKPRAGSQVRSIGDQRARHLYVHVKEVHMHSNLSRRSFFKAGAALAVASRAGIEAGALEPPAARAAASDMPTVEHAPFHKPADVPPIKFMRENIPQAAVVSVRGEYADAVVPDTCDLEERARLFVDNFLNSITVPELMNEPFNRGRFNLSPPRLTLDGGGYECGLAKYREALPLLRMMTGSKKGLDIDQAWAENILKCIGPDGLCYIPLVGRPWDGTGESYYYSEMKGKNAQFYVNLLTGEARLLGTLATYYENTGDEVWNRTARGVVDALPKLAVVVDDWAFFPRSTPYYGEAPLTREQTREAVNDALHPTFGESKNDFPEHIGRMVTGLAQYYRVSGYEPAKQLATQLVNYMRRVKYIEEWNSHFHCVSLVIQGMLELARVAHDEEQAEYARRQYDFAKTGQNMIALPQIGFFVNAQGTEGMEGCVIGDMTALAVKLTQLDMGDQYWEDVDRYARNTLTAIQRTHPGYAETVFAKLWEKGKLQKAPVEYSQLADHLPQRLVGSFGCNTLPNDIFATDYFDSCCNGNCSRALYYAWESILKYDKSRQKLKVNLMLNRTSPWADVNSYIPCSGRVEIKAKRPLTSVQVRAANWVDKGQVACRVGGETRRFSWKGNYLEAGSVKPGETVTLEFPIAERREKLESFEHRYEAVFRGNDCVELTPGGEYYTLFQRGHYRQEEPRYLKVRRFACENTVDY
jgi:hypothetical protein